VLQEESKEDEPLSEAEDSAWAAYFRDVEEYEQIQRDLVRTHQQVPFFSTDDPSSAPHHAVRPAPPPYCPLSTVQELATASQ
jgi:hypothetical protein